MINKVNWQSSEETKRFDELCAGELFCLGRGNKHDFGVFIVLFKDPSVRHNAVKLSNGARVIVRSEALVTPLEGELTVKRATS